MNLPPIKSPKVVSIKMDTAIIEKLDRIARRYGFENQSNLLRFIICAVLEELGELTEKGICYASTLHLRNRFWEQDPDHELILAITDALLRIKLREGQEETTPPWIDYAYELAAALA